MALNNTSKQQNLILLTSTFVSTLGNYIFFICLMSAIVTKGIGPVIASFIIALPRLTSTFVIFIAGSRIDGISARKLMVYCELGAAACSALLFVLWPSIDDHIYLFIAILSIRSAFSNLQLGSRSQVLRQIVGEDSAKNSIAAIALNQSIHGAFVFASVISLGLAKYDLRVPILLDFVTFVIGGIGALFVGQTAPFKNTNQHPFAFISNFYKHLRYIALADVILSVTFCGLSMMIYQLAAGTSYQILYLNLAYGIGVWIAGYIEKIKALRAWHGIYWIIIGFLYLLLIINLKHQLIVVCIALLLFTTYWILFHRYSSIIQSRSPSNFLAGFVSARNSQMFLILISGELIMGQTASLLKLDHQLLIRALVSFAAVIFFYFSKTKKLYAD